METTRLTALNYINFVAYFFNAVIVYALGVVGLLGLTNSEISEKYQSLVTPASWSFSIWGLIFLSQLIFVSVQLLPAYRQHPLVISGVRYYYVGTCMAQVGWSVAFGGELIAFSVVAMLAILTSLILILMSQFLFEATWVEFFLLKFPFLVHCGWIIAATFVNINVWFVDISATSQLQFVVAIISLLGILCAAGYAALIPRENELVVPLVLAWATIGIAVELGNPKDSIVETFSEGNIAFIRISNWVIFGLILVLWLVGVTLYFRRRSTSVDDEEEGATPYVDADEIDEENNKDKNNKKPQGEAA